MSLLLPDAGLLFWMLISFGTVFFLLAKYGFPVIVKMVEERRAYIQKSLEDAKIANDQLSNLKAESDAIIISAKEEQIKILREAHQIREKIVSTAKQEAKELTARQVEDAKREIEKEKEAAIRSIRSQIAMLSVEIAEKVVRTELSKTPAQMNMINRFLEETSEMKS